MGRPGLVHRAGGKQATMAGPPVTPWPRFAKAARRTVWRESNAAQVATPQDTAAAATGATLNAMR
jgi:hypothetical protein